MRKIKVYFAYIIDSVLELRIRCRVSLRFLTNNYINGGLPGSVCGIRRSRHSHCHQA